MKLNQEVKVFDPSVSHTQAQPLKVNRIKFNPVVFESILHLCDSSTSLKGKHFIQVSPFEKYSSSFAIRNE